MKKIVYSTFTVLFCLVMLQAFEPIKLMKKDGAAPGFTGSPGDSFKNCTACHDGVATDVSGWITSDIPTTGYEAGETYNITTTNTEEEGTRFGFQISPQNALGDLMGKIIVTDTIQTKLVGSDKYLTYTANGVDGLGSKTWSFKWVAPQKGAGDVTFYGAYNSNFNGHKDGDKTFLSTLAVKESGSTGINDLPSEVSSLSLYPNPSSSNIAVKIDLIRHSSLIIDLRDITGRLITNISEKKQIGVITKQFNVEDFPNGNYILNIQVNGKTVTRKVLVQH